MDTVRGLTHSPVLKRGIFTPRCPLETLRTRPGFEPGTTGFSHLVRKLASETRFGPSHGASSVAG